MLNNLYNFLNWLCGRVQQALHNTKTFENEKIKAYVHTRVAQDVLYQSINK